MQPQFASERLSRAHVLQLIFGRAARHEVALDHALAMHIENLRLREAAHQRAADRRGISASARSEMQGFGHRDHCAPDDDLVGEFGR